MSAETKPGGGRKPRRRYTPEEKIRLLDEADKPGESIGTVSRRHGIAPSVLFGWRRLRETGAMTAVKADEELGARFRDAGGARPDTRATAPPWEEDRGGRDPQRGPGDRARKKMDLAVAVASAGRRRRMTVAKVFGVSRSQLTIRLAGAQAAACTPVMGQEPSRAGGVKVVEGQVEAGALTPPSTEADAALVTRIRDLVGERATYGYRRVAAVFRRDFRQGCGERINHKRLYRVMRDHGLLLRRHYGDRPGRVHDGVIMTLHSNQRWCSDAFEIRCWNGERVQVAFSLDCCDREVMGYVATTGTIDGELIRDLMLESVQNRFGEGVRRVPLAIQWLTDNGGPYIAHETIAFAESLGLEPCTTPPYSPESNGMAECFVKGFKRDYAYQYEPRTAAVVLENLPRWIDDYNRFRPHKGLKMLSPLEYRQLAS